MNLQYIIGELRGLGDHRGDIESQHVRADKLLVSAIREIRKLPDWYTDAEVEDLISAYENVPKWYA
jgi:hypothetical protein